jgi:hypothetical protein
LVQNGAFSYGSFDARFARANILDVHRPYHFPLPRLLKYLRVNEAQTFHVRSERIFAYFDLYNAKLFTLLYINVYDIKERKRNAYWRFMVGSRLSIPDSLEDSETGFKRGGFDIRVRSRLAGHSIRLLGSVTAYRDKPDLDFDLSFDRRPEVALPLVSVIPFGLNRAVYSFRSPGPVKGRIGMGGEAYLLSDGDSYGIFSDQKGFYPYMTLVDWIIGMGTSADGRRVAFSLTDNHVEQQDAFNENAVWLDGKPYPLPSIRVTRPQGPGGPWIIQDMEGMVDLTFFPEARHSVHVNAIFAESDYHGHFGCFEGWILSPSGERIPADGLYGMGKRKRLRA